MVLSDIPSLEGEKEINREGASTTGNNGKPKERGFSKEQSKENEGTGGFIQRITLRKEDAMRDMQKAGIGLLAFVTTIGCLLGTASGGEKLPPIVVISAREPGSSSYATSVPIAAIVSKYAGFKMTVEPIGGLDKAAPYLARGEIQMSHETSPEILANLKGLWWVKSPKPWVRMVLNNYESPYVWFTQSDSGLTSFRDAQGKKVATYLTNYPAMGLYTDLLLEKFGVTAVTRVRVPSNTAGCTELIEGRADVAGSSVSPRLVDVERGPHGCRLLPLTESDVEYVNKKTGLKICELFSVPPGYLGLKMFAKGIETLGDRGAWATHKDVSEEVIYRVVKAAYEHYSEYKDVYPKCASFTLENALKTFPAPYHPGSIRYFKEKGIWTADHEKRQQELLSALK